MYIYNLFYINIYLHFFKHLYVTVDEKKQILSTNIMALETKPGVLLKLTGDTSPNKFSAAALAGDVKGTCGHLMSIIAMNRGLENTPLTLLGNHFCTALLTIHASHKNVFS